MAETIPMTEGRSVGTEALTDAVAARVADATVSHDRPLAGSAFMWLLLAACGSGLLLATTNQMSMDIAVVPFLWILPLCVYLLTFILAFNVTNRFVDLLPIVQRLADVTELSAIYVEAYSSESRLVNSTDWVLLTRNQAFLDLEVVHVDEEPMPAPGPLWTDDFSSLFEAVEFDN